MQGIGPASGSSVLMLAVDQRGGTFEPLEDVDEVAGVQVTQVDADLGDALAGLPELPLGDLHLLPVHIIREALAGLPVEEPGEIAGAQMAQICHLAHADGGAGVAVDIGYSGIDCAVFGNGGIPDRCIGLRCRTELLDAAAAVLGAHSKQPVVGLCLVALLDRAVDDIADHGVDQLGGLLDALVFHLRELL